MLDVAIIDDDIESIKAIKDILSGIEIVGVVESYQSFETFFEAADGDNHYDVILQYEQMKCEFTERNEQCIKERCPFHK